MRTVRIAVRTSRPDADSFGIGRLCAFLPSMILRRQLRFRVRCAWLSAFFVLLENMALSFEVRAFFILSSVV